LSSGIEDLGVGLTFFLEFLDFIIYPRQKSCGHRIFH